MFENKKIMAHIRNHVDVCEKIYNSFIKKIITHAQNSEL